MQMTEQEIVKSYKNAKDKRSQVGVLAELNACSNDYIRQILHQNGIEAPKPGRKTEQKEPEKVETLEVPKEVIELVQKRAKELRQEIEGLKLQIGKTDIELQILESWLKTAKRGAE